MWPLGFRCGEMLPSIRLWIDLIPDLCFVQWPLPAVEWLHCTSWCSMKHNIVFRKSISIGQRWHTLHAVVTNASMDLQQKSLICTDGNIEPFDIMAPVSVQECVGWITAKKKILFRSPSTPCLQICLQPPGFTKEHTMSNPMRLLDLWHSIGHLSGKISMKLTKRMVGKNSNNCLTYFQYHPMSFHAMIPQMHGCQPLLNLTPKLERELMQSQLRNWNSFQGKPSPASLMFAICIRTVFQSGLWLQRFAPWIRLRVRCHCLHKANLHPEPDLPTLCFSLVYPSLEIHVNVVSSTNNRYASRPWKFDSSMQCTGDHRTMSDQRRSSNGSCPWIFLAQFFHAVAFRKEMLLVFWLCWPLPFYGPVLSTINS